MRNRLFIGAAAASLVLAAGINAQAQSYSNAVMALNPVAYWPLAETVAAPAGLYVATNSGTLGDAGNGYYETWYQPMGGTMLLPTNVIQHPVGVTKDSDTALQNSLVGQHVIIPRATNGVANPAVTIAPPFSIELWAYPTNGAASGGIKPLVSEGFINTLNGSSLGNQAVSQGFAVGSYNNIFYFSVFNGAGAKTERDSGAYTANTWHHLVATFDGTTIVLYDNGKPSSVAVTARDALGRNYAPDLVSPLLIGSGGNQNSPFGGIIDEVAIYNTVLTAQQVTNHFYAQTTNAPASFYTTTVVNDHPTIYLRLDEPAFTSAPDLSACPVANNYGSLGSAANGHYQPGATPGIAGPAYIGFGASSQAVALDGFNAGVDVGLGSVPALLNPTGNQPLSVMTWFRANPADCVGRYQNILGHSDLGWRLGLDATAGNRFNPGAGPELLFGSVAAEVNSGFFLNDGNWHFAAGVSDGTNDYLYLDGVLAKSGTSVGSIAGTNLDVILGGDPQYTAPTLGPSGSRYFDGSIAQVAFFTNALSSAQIQQIYSAAGVPPLVRVQPLPQGAFVGQSVTLSPVIFGSAPFTYQWYRNGSQLSGQNAATLTFNPITLSNAGSYYVAVINAYGGTVSAVARIAVDAASSYASAVQSLNAAAYWPLDETTPPPAGAYVATNLGTVGAAGNGIYQTWYQRYTVGTSNLYYQTNNIAHVAGAIGDADTALSCTRSAAGAGQYVVFPRSTNGVANSALTLQPPFSIEFWVNPAGVLTTVMPIVNEGRLPVLDPRTAYTTTNWDGFCVGQYGGNVFFATYNGSGGDSSKQELDVPITSGVWQHMVVTFDGVNQTWYKNGSFVNTRAIPASTVNAFGQLYMPDVTSPLLIGTGSELSAGNGATEYSGSIDDVAIYTNILDPTAIANHYAAASATDATYQNMVVADNPAIYVRLGEPAFNAYPSPSTYPIANNYGTVGGAANGVYQPGTTPGVSGPGYSGFGGPNRAVAINGFSGGVDVGGGLIPAALNPTGTQPLTFSAWFQANPADAPARFQAIASHGNSACRLTLDNVASGVRFNPGNNPELQFTNALDVVTNNAVVNDGGWHFIAGVSDGATALMYIDGVLVKTNTGVGGLIGSTSDFLLGGDPDNLTPVYNSGGTAIRYFDGQIAQVAFFTNALTAAQIQQLYSAAGVPPVIAVQPPALVGANSGQTVSIPITAKGSAPLAYQWYRTNGTAVAGQTTAALTFNPVALANSGSYYARVTNSYGAATSSVVQLTVIGPPVVEQQSPTDLRVFVGTTPALRVVAVGPAPISYQWTMDGSPVTGANTSSFQPSTAATGSHNYGCTITNVYSGNVASPFSTIAVTVLARPTAPYPVAVLNDHPLDYFRLDESPDNGTGNNGLPAYDYAGGLNASYTNALIAQPNSGYDSQFTPQTDPAETGALFGYLDNSDSFAGNVSSFLNFATNNGASAAFSVEAWVDGVTGQPSGAGIVALGYGNGGEQFVLDAGAPGSDYRFFVRNAAGTATLANGTNAPNDALWHHVVGVCDQANGHVYLYVDGLLTASGAMAVGSGLLNWSAPLSIGSRQSGIGTPYDSQFNGYLDDVAIYGYALSPAQVLAHYTSAGVPPIIARQPSDVTTNAGATAILTVAAIGTAPLSYQWYDNNSQPIPTGTSATLTLPNVQPSQTGGYYVTVSNAYSATPVSSASAFLTVNAGPPVIDVDLQPPHFIGYANRQFTYTIGVSGTAPFTFVWTRNGTTIAGATSSAYSFTTLAGTNLYAVTVKNAQNPTGVASSTVTNVGVAAPTLNPGDYAYKAKIRFAGYNRGETLANFPALVQFGTNLPGFAYSQLASSVGGDLRFTDATGTNQIPHEIDEWNPADTSAVWVQMSTLSSTNDAVWAYWGNPAATTPLAWSTNGTVWLPLGSTTPYDVVYHLKEGALPFQDSTQQKPAINGVAPAATPGIVGTGGAFDGSDWLDAGTNDLGDAFTLSGWINITPGISDIQTLWANQVGGYGNAGFAFGVNTYKATDQKIYLATGIGGGTGKETTSASGTVSFGQWHLLEAAINRTNGTVVFYLDGVSALSSTDQPNFTSAADLHLGRFIDPNFYMHGTMDEARIQSGVVSPNWAWADYMTVAQNTSFLLYSPASTSLVKLGVQLVNGQLVLSWPTGTLLQAPTLTGPWTTNSAASPFTNSVTGANQFYRIIVR
jgi:hypothetical protein